MPKTKGKKKEKKGSAFYPLYSDTVFKFLFKNKKCRFFFEEMIEKETGVNLQGLEMIESEYSVGKAKMGMRLDCMLEDKENKILYNLEMNSSDESFFIKRNIRNLSMLIIDVYDHYKGYRIYQINLNVYKYKQDKKRRHNCIMLQDENYRVFTDFYKIYNIYLSQIANTCYDNIDRRAKLIIAKSYSAMSRIAGKDKVVNLIVREVKDLNKRKPFRAYYNAEREQKWLLEEAAVYYYDKGMKASMKSGIKTGKLEVAQRMLYGNIDINTIRKASPSTQNKNNSENLNYFFTKHIAFNWLNGYNNL